MRYRRSAAMCAGMVRVFSKRRVQRGGALYMSSAYAAWLALQPKKGVVGMGQQTVTAPPVQQAVAGSNRARAVRKRLPRCLSNAEHVAARGMVRSPCHRSSEYHHRIPPGMAGYWEFRVVVEPKLKVVSVQPARNLNRCVTVGGTAYRGGVGRRWGGARAWRREFHRG